MGTSHRCDRCGYTAKTKQHMLQHLGRKNICPATYSDTSIADMISRICTDAERKPDAKCECSFCGREFNHRNNMYKHKRICKKRPSDNDTVAMDALQEHMREEIRKLREEISQKQASHMTQTNCNITTNNVQININPFGKEDTSHLTHSFLNKCVRKTDRGLIELIEKLHFDPNVKENANVRKSARRLPALLEYNDGEKWKYERKDKVLTQMLDQGHDILQEHWDDNEATIKSDVSECMYQHISEWLQGVQENKQTHQDLLVDIYALILNNS